MIVGLINNNDETANIVEVELVSAMVSGEQSVYKTKMSVDIRKTNVNHCVPYCSFMIPHVEIFFSQ